MVMEGKALRKRRFFDENKTCSLPTDLSRLAADDPRTATRAAAVVVLVVVDDDTADEASVTVGV